MAFLFHFCPMGFICFNGNFLPADQPVITAQNRGFKYGDGIFETIKIFDNRMVLEEYHFDRLFFGLQLLRIAFLDVAKEEIVKQILVLCEKNKCPGAARVRLAVYRNEDDTASYIIEAMPLSVPNQLNKDGWSVDLYPFARKSMDAFANLKTANYLPYVLADKYAKEKGLDECIVLNASNHICDASKANIFLVVKDEIFTPALHQGCVNGVMRRFLLEEFKKLGVTVYQKEIEEKMLFDADEVFLTNCINDMRWVNSFRDKRYKKDFASEVYQRLFSTIYL